MDGLCGLYEFAHPCGKSFTSNAALIKKITFMFKCKANLPIPQYPISKNSFNTQYVNLVGVFLPN